MIVLDGLYWIFYRSAWLLMFTFKSFFPKVAKGFELRKNVNGLPAWTQFPKNTKPLWIHCPSGEFEYALPLIRELKKQKPSQKILVTYYTPSYVNRIGKEPLVDYYCPLPWDRAHDLKTFIEHHQPQQLLIARTGAWPEMLKQCHLHKVPVTFFSMTFNKQLNLWSGFLYRWLYRYVNAFYVVAPKDAETLQQVNASAKIVVMGDSRYDQCLFRLQANAFLKVARDLLPHKVFVCASTWPEDEAVLLPYIAKNHKELHFIVVPHEIEREHIESVQKQLEGLGVNTYLYSEIHTWNSEGVLIVDELGVLASLYKIADGAFIGGSFKSRVHSVMESLACGNITFVGPFHTNNREALEFSELKATSIAPVQIIKTNDEVSAINAALSAWTAIDRDTLKRAFVAKAGVSEKLAKIFLAQST